MKHAKLALAHAHTHTHIHSSSKSWLTSPAVNLNHFRLLRVVGKGAFGKVRIVERKDTGLTFALKYIRKDEGGCMPSHASCYPAMLTSCHSRTVGKRPQHHTRAPHA